MLIRNNRLSHYSPSTNVSKIIDLSKPHTLRTKSIAGNYLFSLDDPTGKGLLFFISCLADY